MTRYHARVLHSIEKNNLVPVVVLVVESKGLFLNFLVNLHSFFQRGQKQVHAIDKKELLPLKDVSTMNQQPIRFKLGPVCFQ